MYIYNGTILVLADGLIICTGQYILKSYSLKHVPFHSGRRAQFPDNDFIVKLHNRNLHRMSPYQSSPPRAGEIVIASWIVGGPRWKLWISRPDTDHKVPAPHYDTSLLKSSIISIRP